MSDLNAQPLPFSLDSKPTSFSINDILNQESYITNLRDFLAEESDTKALSYWVNEYTPVKNLKTVSDILNAISSAIAEFDEIINEQVNAIIHNQKYQKLEASWRGLWYLVEQADGSQNIKIKMLDVSWPEVSKDIQRALEFDQSQLFLKIYSEEYGTPGGEPYGVLIGDYEVSHHTSDNHQYDDIATLEGLAQIAAASFSPFITSASSELFGLNNFSGLGQPIDLEAIFQLKEYTRWRALREKPDTRFLGITVPRILVRRPYNHAPGSYKNIFFEESCADTDNNRYLWGNACYAFGAVLIREFATVGWFGHIRGVPRNYVTGGLVTNLPSDEFSTDAEGIACKPMTDVIITDAMEKELSELGFIPLCQSYNAPCAAFYNNQSIQQPKDYTSGNVKANAKLSSMLQHILCGSRIAHYIKIMIRDKIGSFVTANECEDYLRNWLYEYTTGREDLEWEDQARYPLREAAVSVTEHPAKPGEYMCAIHLRPHYQLDHMVSELELVTELASLGLKA